MVLSGLYVSKDVASDDSSLYSTDLSEIINEIPPIRKKIKLSSV